MVHAMTHLHFLYVKDQVTASSHNQARSKTQRGDHDNQIISPFLSAARPVNTEQYPNTVKAQRHCTARDGLGSASEVYDKYVTLGRACLSTISSEACEFFRPVGLCIRVFPITRRHELFYKPSLLGESAILSTATQQFGALPRGFALACTSFRESSMT